MHEPGTTQYGCQENSKMDYSNLLLKKKISILLILCLICKRGNTDCLIKTDKCPQDVVSWYTRSREFNCSSDYGVYTCILTGDDRFVETCMIRYEIDAGATGCPVVNICGNYGAILVPSSSYSECFHNITGCPNADHTGYFSNQMYIYPRCLRKRSERYGEIQVDITTHEDGLFMTATNPQSREITTAGASSEGCASDYGGFLAFRTLAFILLTFDILLLIACLTYRREIYDCCKTLKTHQKQMHLRSDEEGEEPGTTSPMIAEGEEREGLREAQRGDETVASSEESEEHYFQAQGTPSQHSTRESFHLQESFSNPFAAYDPELGSKTPGKYFTSGGECARVTGTVQAEESNKLEGTEEKESDFDSMDLGPIDIRQ